MTYSPEIAKFGGIIRRRLGLLNTEELAATLECSASAVRSWRVGGSGPRFCRLGRRIYYREEDVQTWALEQANKEQTDAEESDDTSEQV